MVSAGLLLVFGVMKIINFAHGALLTVGSYAAVTASSLGLDPWLALPGAAIVGGAGRHLHRMGGGAPALCQAARCDSSRPGDWGIVIGQLLTIAFGRGVHFAEPPLKGTVSVIGVDYSIYRLALVAVAIALGACISWLLAGTRLGLDTRAVIMNEDLARGCRHQQQSRALHHLRVGSALAAAAGMLITPLSSVDPNMGVPWLVNAFMLVLVSGSSLLSLAIACLVLGGAQVLVSSYLSPVLGGLTIAVLAAIILRVSRRASPMLKRSDPNVLDAGQIPHRKLRLLLPVLVASLASLAVVGASPFLLDTYSINVLTRSLLYAGAALTVDLLWGYMGILTFGQSAFFAAGAYSAGLIFTHVGFGPGTALIALALGIAAAIAMALIVGWLAFWHGVSELYASVITLVLPIVLHPGTLFGGSVYGLQQRPLRLRELRSVDGSLVLDRRRAAGGADDRRPGFSFAVTPAGSSSPSARMSSAANISA